MLTDKLLVVVWSILMRFWSRIIRRNSSINRRSNFTLRSEALRTIATLAPLLSQHTVTHVTSNLSPWCHKCIPYKRYNQYMPNWFWWKKSPFCPTVLIFSTAASVCSDRVSNRLSCNMNTPYTYSQNCHKVILGLTSNHSQYWNDMFKGARLSNLLDILFGKLEFENGKLYVR